jgi:phage/conjugal plasmid C-4 type zinc finger TraR family protein
MKPEDQAQKFELSEWEARQKRAIQPKPSKPSATHCRDPLCGEEIPEARRLAQPGVQLCVGCQQYNEFMESKYASAN